ncbi:MAG: hypothetical protein ACRDY7_17445 [Acidimicrobiia bacterium]
MEARRLFASNLLFEAMFRLWGGPTHRRRRGAAVVLGAVFGVVGWLLAEEDTGSGERLATIRRFVAEASSARFAAEIEITVGAEVITRTTGQGRLTLPHRSRSVWDSDGEITELHWPSPGLPAPEPSFAALLEPVGVAHTLGLVDPAGLGELLASASSVTSTIQLSEHDAEGTVTLELACGDDGRLQRMRWTLDARPTPAGGGPDDVLEDMGNGVQVRAEVSFSDWDPGAP